MCLTRICLHQGLEGKVMFLEKKLAELKQENKPLSSTLTQTIRALCAEEVGMREFCTLEEANQQAGLLKTFSHPLKCRRSDDLFSHL